MAQINRQKGGGYIVFDESDWGGGYMAQGGQDSALLLKGNGVRYSINFDPYRNLGFASPGFNQVEATNNAQVTGVITATALRNATYEYGVTSDGKVQEHNITNNTVTNAGSFPHTIDHAHTGETGSDVVIYRHNLGGSLTTSLFYSFYDATDWDVGCYETFTTFNDDFMSTIPATPLGTTAADLTDGKSLPHPLEVGADDILYMGSGRYLHGYDGSTGTNGTFYSKVLTLPAGFIIQDLLKTEQFLLIAGVFSSGTVVPTVDESQEAYVYLWNYLDQDVTDIIPLDDQYVSVLRLWRNRPVAITAGEKGNRGRNRVKIILGSTAETVAEYAGSQPALGGVDSASDQLLINSAGKIITVGNPFESNSYEVNQITSTGLTTASGFVRNIFSTNQKIFASAGAQLVELSSGFKETASYYSGIVEPVFPTNVKGRVKAVTIIYKGSFTAAASRNFALQLFTDYDNVSTLAYTNVTAITATNLMQKVTYNTSGTAFPEFFNLGIVMTWSDGVAGTNAAQVSKVIVEFEEVEYINT